jgi:DNA replication licensing factor MCM3
VTNLAEMGDETKTMVGGGENFMTRDNQGNPLSPEYGYCLYKDSQVVTIQEMPENAQVGQLPRSIQVILQNDLVDKLKPGDRCQVSGVYKAAPMQSLGVTRGTFRTQIIATGCQSLLLEKEKPSLSEKDISNFRKLSKSDALFETLGSSIAPSIEGHLNVKKSILL